jgi:predicted CXXCH cytochrome family protein
LGEDEKCFACHKEQRGPFVFVHDAMREGCSSCHNPHGSINEKLLIAGQTTTCIRCHWEVSFNGSLGSIGRFPHGFFSIGRGSECIDCHTAPHGSNIWRTLTR